MNHYLYGIVSNRQAGRASNLKELGIGSPLRPPKSVAHGSIAAIVSCLASSDRDTAHLLNPRPVDPTAKRNHLRALRRDMRAHAAVLNKLAETVTVLPVRFGVVLPDERTLVQSILAPQHDVFHNHLQRLNGLVEITLNVNYIEDRIIEQVVALRPELARGGARGAPSRATYHGRIETGKQIAGAIRHRKQRDAEQVVLALKPHVREIVISETESEMAVLKASLLVERARIPAFDKAIGQLHASTRDVMQLDCVGPLPPYSFVPIRI